MAGPCDDLRILDLSSGPAGGIATMVLADFGADVVKIERPGGDPFRTLAASPMWLRGKRSVVLDLSTDEGRAHILDLARDADAVVASFRPGRAAVLGADYPTLGATNLGLVYCSITGWGANGPLAAYAPYEGVVAAKSGRMQSFAGQPQRDGPAYSAVQIGIHGAAQAALSGVLGALLARERDGRGQLVETSLLQGMFPYDLFGLVRTLLARSHPVEFGDDPFAKYAPMPTFQYHPVMAKDGRWIQLANLLEHHFHAFINAVGLSEIYADPELAGAPNQLEPEGRERLRDIILERLQERPADEWLTLFAADGQIASEPFQSAQAGLDHPDVIANGEVGEHDHPKLGRIRQLGPLARLAETPGVVAAPAPEVGEHTTEVLEQLSRRPATRPAATASPDSRPPLEGLKVVEFGTIIAAPLGVAFLADLGARVIKVEPLEGDPYRGMGLGNGMYIGISKTSAGKESICVDLKRPEGVEIVHELLRDADIVMHNFRPGVPERLGIGYEQVRALSPNVIYLQVNGYGSEGPSAARPAAHPIPGAAVGGALYQAGAAMPPPHASGLEEIREVSRWLFRANEGNPDPSTGNVVQNAALLALYARKRFGRGQLVSLSMMGANAYANSDDFLTYKGKPERPPVDADLHGLSALYRLYRAASGWVFLGVVTEGEWAAFCEAAGRRDLADDARFATREARREHDEALAEELTRLFAERDAAEWEQLLAPAGVGCVQADADVPGTFFADSPQMATNGFDVRAEHAMWGAHQRWGPQVLLRGTPGSYRAGALAGQHTDTLLAEIGYDTEAIRRLREKRVVTSEQPIELTAAATS